MLNFGEDNSEILLSLLNTFASRLIQVVHVKTARLHVALCRNFSGLVSDTDLVKSSNDSASLVVCTRNNFFGWGVWIFCEWRHKWRTFRPPWSTLPGPRWKPLDGSISLKFLLETRLKSESFDSLDDLLGLRVQKWWSKAGFFNSLAAGLRYIRTLISA